MLRTSVHTGAAVTIKPIPRRLNMLKTMYCWSYTSLWLEKSEDKVSCVCQTEQS